MTTDFFFRMGYTHNICQDYALSGVTSNGKQFAMVSDGCSDLLGAKALNLPGATFTDFGARFLVRSACKYIQDTGDIPYEKVITEAAGMARQAMLPQSSLNATLLGVVQEGEDVHIFKSGDGAILLKYLDGTTMFGVSRYENNKPFYMSYILDRVQLETYIETAGFESAYSKVKIGQTWENHHTSRESLSVPSVVEKRVLPAKDLEMVLLFSDGVESFVDSKNSPIPIEVILNNVLDMKSFNGDFISRRCKAFLKRTCQKNGWKHLDDFSVAGIYLKGA